MQFGAAMTVLPSVRSVQSPSHHGAECQPASRPAARHELLASGLALTAGLAALGLMVGATFFMRGLQMRFTPNPNAPLPVALLPALPTLEPERYMRGRELFVATCATCHGPHGLGVRGLGKDLTRSLFVCERSDGEVVAFIRRGREINDPLNTTKVPMPPLGGNPSFTSDDLEHIVAYLRGLQDPRRKPDVPDISPLAFAAVGPVTPDEKASALAAAGGDAELAEYIAHGTKLFVASCAACHGRDAHGMLNLGKDLVTSEFAKKLDDDALLAFLKKGRDPSDPLNTTKVGMPPKGGNPALSDDDLLDIIAFLRSIEKSAASKSQ